MRSMVKSLIGVSLALALMCANVSAQGTAERQAWVADLADEGLFGTKGTPGFARSSNWRTEADRILAMLKQKD